MAIPLQGLVAGDSNLGEGSVSSDEKRVPKIKT